MLGPIVTCSLNWRVVRQTLIFAHKSQAVIHFRPAPTNNSRHFDSDIMDVAVTPSVVPDRIKSSSPLERQPKRVILLLRVHEFEGEGRS